MALEKNIVTPPGVTIGAYGVIRRAGTQIIAGDHKITGCTVGIYADKARFDAGADTNLIAEFQYAIGEDVPSSGSVADIISACETKLTTIPDSGTWQSITSQGGRGGGGGGQQQQPWRPGWIGATHVD